MDFTHHQSWWMPVHGNHSHCWDQTLGPTPRTTSQAAAAPVHQTSWHISPWKQTGTETIRKLYLFIFFTKNINKQTNKYLFIYFGEQEWCVSHTWLHSRRPEHQSQRADPRLSHGRPHRVPAQKATQQCSFETYKNSYNNKSIKQEELRSVENI